MGNTVVDKRAVTAHVVTRSPWGESFGFKVRSSKKTGHVAHINVLECQALLVLLKQLRSRKITAKRILVFIDCRVVLGAASKGRSSARLLNNVLKKVAGECLLTGMSLDLIWIPAWAKPGDVPSRAKSLEDWRRS